MWSKSAGHVVTVGICSHCYTKLPPKQPIIAVIIIIISIIAVQETEPLDIIIVRRGQRSTGEAFVLLRMPIQVELVLRKNKTYIGKRYVEVTLAKKLVRSCLT